MTKPCTCGKQELCDGSHPLAGLVEIEMIPVYTYQVGISGSTWPFAVNWTPVYVSAKDEEEAARKAHELGYYRNLELRRVSASARL